MPLTPRTILDQYEILSPLGAGGMGEVYRARDLRLNREVAIKVLHDLSSSEPDRLRRFEQEARAAAALNHPNILAVYQMGTFDGDPYLVSELLEGETLRERLNKGPLPLRKVIDYGVQIARGLAAAHEKGIVHRDLKPENLFVSRDGQVKILDFGLARMAPTKESPGALNGSDTDATQAGIVMGTAGYMSPEQVRGRVADHRSDLFAFSVVLYEMLTGRRAFQKQTAVETMTAILNEDPPWTSKSAATIPPSLQRVVHRGLEKNPEERFQSASDLAFALEALSDTTLLTLPIQPIAEKKPHQLRPVIVGAMLAAILTLGVLTYLWMQPDPVPKVANYVQLTHDGLQKSLIGTDGSRLYLTLINSGAQDAAAIEISGGQQVNIQMPSLNMVPVDLSPDGSHFLVLDGTGFPVSGPFWSLPIMGGSPRRLSDTSGEVATWSPDGKMMAYTSGGTIFLANGDGTEPRKLLTMKTLVADMAWSPDGKRLRFGTSEFPQSGVAGTEIGPHLLWEVAADGSNPHRLLSGWHNPPDECCGKWTSDGKYFIFQSQGQIWALSQKPGLLHPYTQPIQLTASPMSLHSPIPSRDGKKLFVVGQTYRGELERYDSKTHVFAPFLYGISAEFLSFSKDGQWVAFVSYPEGTLWKSRADGSERVQLTFPPLGAVLPRWSPDGKTIVFFDFPQSSTQPGRIYVISADGGSPRELIPNDPHNQQDPTWSVDGSKIAYAGTANDAAVSDGAPALHIYDLQSQRITSLPDSHGLFSPRWSPDGQTLAAMTSDSRSLRLFDFKTQKWTDIAKGSFGWPTWSNDGKYIYAMDGTGKGAVLRIGIKDHQVERVADLKNFVAIGQGGSSFSLAPDDSPLLLRDTGTQDVYSLDWITP
jgi:serine/threonine protein kinase/Tol biopolymer transport system component